MSYLYTGKSKITELCIIILKLCVYNLSFILFMQFSYTYPLVTFLQYVIWGKYALCQKKWKIRTIGKAHVQSRHHLQFMFLVQFDKIDSIEFLKQTIVSRWVPIPTQKNQLPPIGSTPTQLKQSQTPSIWRATSLQLNSCIKSILKLTTIR